MSNSTNEVFYYCFANKRKVKDYWSRLSEYCNASKLRTATQVVILDTHPRPVSARFCNASDAEVQVI